MAGIWNVAGPEVNGYVLLAIDRKSLKWNKRYTRMKQHFRLIIEWPNTNWIWALIFCQAAKFYLCLIFVNLDTQILKECSITACETWKGEKQSACYQSSSGSSNVHYMNIAFQLVNWWRVVLACLSGTKYPSSIMLFWRCCSRSLSFISKCSGNKRKTKEMFKFRV